MKKRRKKYTVKVFFVFICICSIVANLVILVRQLAPMCPKPKHLKHFILGISVGYLVVEVESVRMYDFKLEGG